MTPFHFGSGARRLFGLYTPAHSGAASTRAALLCAPWGQEYLRSHRSMRLLGRQLAAQGWHVKAITSASVAGRLGPGGVDGLIVTFERPLLGH